MYQLILERTFLKQKYKYFRGYLHYYSLQKSLDSKLIIYDTNVKMLNEEKIVISKAGGMVNNKLSLNSIEGVKKSLKSDNCHIIELDFHLTSDNFLVLNHDWNAFNKTPSRTKFLSQKRKDDLTNLDFEGLEYLLDKTNKKNIITDIKVNNVKILNNLIINSRHKDLFIPQVYNFQQYLFVVNHFNKIIFSNYIYEYPPNILKIIDNLENMYAITISEKYYLKHKKQIDDLSFNSKLFLHPIKSKKMYLKYSDFFDGFYSYSCDFITNDYD